MKLYVVYAYQIWKVIGYLICCKGISNMKLYRILDMLLRHIKYEIIQDIWYAVKAYQIWNDTRYLICCLMFLIKYEKIHDISDMLFRVYEIWKDTGYLICCLGISNLKRYWIFDMLSRHVPNMKWYVV